MTPLPHRLRSFQGAMLTLVVDQDKHCVVALSNRVSFIDARVWARSAFEADYQPVRVVEDGVAVVLRQFKGYALKVGLTPRAAVYLTKLIEFTPAELLSALTLGQETLARIQKEAHRMAQTDKTPAAGKAPRKLAGAALAAVQRREARLAAEAKQLAGQVTEDQNARESSGAIDARLPNTPVKRTADKGKTPKVTKATPSAEQARKIVKGKARVDAQISATGQFDPAKLKNAAGDYRSVSAMCKGLIYDGKHADEAIAKQVTKKFGLDDQKAKDYVAWNRGWFRRNGVDLAQK